MQITQRDSKGKTDKKTRGNKLKAKSKMVDPNSNIVIII